MPWCFIHIPKTAGSSFAATIRAHTGIDSSPHRLMFHYFDWPLGDHEFYAGHAFYQTVKTILPPDTRYMTLLRDPINRIFSHWTYMGKTSGYVHYGLDEHLPFSEWIRHRKTRALAHNFQCRYLTLEVGPGTTLQHQLTLERMPFDSWDEAVELALESLSTFAVVGIQEKFPSAVMTACITMGYSPPTDIEQVHTDYYDQISNEDLDYLMVANDADWRIYNAYSG